MLIVFEFFIIYDIYTSQFEKFIYYDLLYIIIIFFFNNINIIKKWYNILELLIIKN